MRRVLVGEHAKQPFGWGDVAKSSRSFTTCPRQCPGAPCKVEKRCRDVLQNCRDTQPAGLGPV
eukprot:3694344-Lingulodinium_polyedra.AAC.1